MARVRDVYRDQLIETGHAARRGDIDRIASLGVTAVRYPIVWERIAPDRPDQCDFAWTDDRLAMLRERGIRVIGGLLHHGSGPRYTSLLDPDFPAKLADYAARVADRYPWIETWTPVNEPLTTARFSGLYGHWYPHGSDSDTMHRALLSECQGTAAAMQAIRSVNPVAQLLQTEDLGKIFATDPLRYQADHENERRWLSFDLLAGHVDPDHAFWSSLRRAGASEADLAAFRDGNARPDMLGINHYLTSERFLDHRLGHYESEPGSNGRESYHDVEAVRVEALDRQTGIGPRLREAWERYRIPIAITEVHHGCTRDEQLRWFAEVWRTAQAQRRLGIDVRAVTLWSLFGNVDWRSLLTRHEDLYDVGVFDVRAPEPRPTVIAKAARAFANGENFDHPVLDMPGWWRRPERLYPWHGASKTLESDGRKLLITGATGTLGQALARIAEHRGLPFVLTSRAELDIADDMSIAAAIARHRPWAVINAAGFVRVADAESEQDACMLANAVGPEKLARACTDAGLPLVAFSSDLVFDGRIGRAYREDDATCPDTVYGKSKAEAERRVLAAGGNPLIVRTSAFFGPWDRYNFAWHVLSTLARGELVRASRASTVSITYVPDLCHAVLDLLIDGESGIWHLANQGGLSWHEFACRLAEGKGYDRSLIVAEDGEERSTELGSSRHLLRPFEQAIDAFLWDVADRAELRSHMEVAAE